MSNANFFVRRSRSKEKNLISNIFAKFSDNIITEGSFGRTLAGPEDSDAVIYEAGSSRARKYDYVFKVTTHLWTK